jgi:hypothetical protein
MFCSEEGACVRFPDVAEDGGEDLDRHQGADLDQLGHLRSDDQHVEEEEIA